MQTQFLVDSFNPWNLEMMGLRIREQNRWAFIFQSPKKYRKTPDVSETKITREQ